jgi:hypothetical protein
VTEASDDTTGLPSDAPLPSVSAGGVTIEQGLCSLFYAFDVGFAIDLERAEAVLQVARTRAVLKPRRRAPHHFQYQPPPIRLMLTAAPIEVAGFSSRDRVDAVLFDFGAVSLTYQIPFRGSVSDLVTLGEELYENEKFEDAAEAQVRHIVELIQPAVNRPMLSDAVEDYAVFHVESLSGPIRPATFLRAHRLGIAQLLRSERAALSRQEIDDAFLVRLSYSEQDVAVIDWNAALVLDPDPGDVLPVLEYANVQLVEMRLLDNELDNALESAYAVLSRRVRRLGLFGGVSGDLRKIALLQADGAMMFESVTNALKLLGDPYMARVYRAVSGRFHLRDWDASILRKLEVLDSIYSKLSSQQQNLRLEILEWIIILLIALSIVLSLVGGVHA